ncbi:MAG: SEC-C domain-containing protein [Gammaproteobacteria bacterium]|nr:SEC-C domain-containing protein [Gammaproteobacteria bacterium]
MKLKTALELMRSRYQAYKNKDENYLLQTWEISTRPVNIDFSSQPQWLGLEIISTKDGMEKHNIGYVHFKAYYIDNKKISCLEENSRFIKDNEQWFYCDGEIFDNSARVPARNELCPCQSGKKFKRCCINKLA